MRRPLQERKSTPAENKACANMFKRVSPTRIHALGQVTMFGGPDDIEDNGQTACGHSTLNTEVLYCSLPIPVWKRFKLKCEAVVVFYNQANGKSVQCVLWDEGPSAWLMRPGDIAPKAMKLLGGTGKLDDIEVQVHA